MYKEIITKKDYENNEIGFVCERFIAESYHELFQLLRKNFRQYDENKNNFPSYAEDGVITLLIHISKNEYIKIIDDKKIQVYHYIYDDNVQVKRIVKFLNFKDMFDYVAIITQSEILSR